MTFWDHLEELRRVLLKCLAVVTLFGILAFCFKEEVFAIVFAPKSPDFIGGIWGEIPEVQLINTELTRQFVMHMMVSCYAGLLAATPYILFEIYRFISPALYQNEKRYSLPALVFGSSMFMLGVCFCYFVLFPITFRFLGSYQVDESVENLISLESYIDTLMFLCLAMGIVFEMPLLSWLLGKLGLLKRDAMQKYRRHAIVAIIIVAAVITPTTDAFTLGIVSIPMYLLYEISIFVVPKKRINKIQ